MCIYLTAATAFQAAYQAAVARLADAACPAGAGAAAFLMPRIERPWRSAPQAFHLRDALKHIH